MIMQPSQVLPKQPTHRQPKQPPKNQQDFDRMYEELTKRQREILFQFLEGKSDQQIAQELYYDPSNIRRHLANVFRVFGLSDHQERKGDRCRDELKELFLRYKRELVSDDIAIEHGYPAKWVYSSARSRPAGELPHPALLQVPGIPAVLPEIPGRPMKPDSPFYVQPKIAVRCCEEVLVPGQLIRIRAPQMTGKTSLLYQILNQARQQRYRTIALNLRYDVDSSDLENLATFLAWFCRAIALSLGLPATALPTTKLDCTAYVQDQILVNLEAPLVVALDEVEVLFDHVAIAQDFFSLLRGWHESAKEPGLEIIWEKLRLVIVHSTNAYIHFACSPFENVGYVVGLPPLPAEQVQALAQRYGLHHFTAAAGDRLMALVGRHPYLIQQAFYSLARDGLTLDTLLAEAATLGGIYRSHLQELLQRLDESPQVNLAEALRQVIAAEGTVRLNQEQTFRLVGLGLVQLQGNQVCISCELYQQFFQDWL